VTKTWANSSTFLKIISCPSNVPPPPQILKPGVVQPRSQALPSFSNFIPRSQDFLKQLRFFFIFIFKCQSRDFLRKGSLKLRNRFFGKIDQETIPLKMQSSSTSIYTLLIRIFDVRFRFYNMTYEAILPEIGTKTT
jgi:hypothetical protein